MSWTPKRAAVSLSAESSFPSPSRGALPAYGLSGTGSRGPLAVAESAARVRIHNAGQVLVLEPIGRLADVAAQTSRMLQLALTDEARGVVCDLGSAQDVTAAAVLDILAPVESHLRAWPGMPVAVVHPTRQTMGAIAASASGDIVTASASLPDALSRMLRPGKPEMETLRVAAVATSPRAARVFVTKALATWGLDRCATVAALVVGELVTNAVAYGRSDIEVSIAAHRQTVRLAVRDHAGVRRLLTRSTDGGRRGGLDVVEGLARAWGVLPAEDGGKVVWAVVNPRFTRLGPA
jgi:anti-sigma regulatory factor (Ser/Thr protein kinase)/virulence-associated protein VagC